MTFNITIDAHHWRLKYKFFTKLPKKNFNITLTGVILTKQFEIPFQKMSRLKVRGWAKMRIVKMTEKRWPNSTAETCKMTKFARTVNLNQLSLTKFIFCQTQNLRFTVLLFGQVTKVFGHLYSVILQRQIRSSFFGHLN